MERVATHVLPTGTLPTGIIVLVSRATPKTHIDWKITPGNSHGPHAAPIQRIR
jgi:hypothetical protein